MSRFTVVTDVSQWGLLSWPAQSRARLVATTLVMTALSLGIGLSSAHFILESSASVILNLALITLNMLVVLVTALLQAALAGDLFFSKNWRQRVLLGQQEKKKKDDLDIAAIEDHNAEFIVIIAIAAVLNILAINVLAGDFYGQYHNEGFFVVQMRADEPADRMEALESIADPLNHRLWERDGLRQLVVDSIDDDDESVRQRAIWTAGIMEILRARHRLRELATDDQTDGATRADAAFSLGRLGNRSASRNTLEQLLDPSHPAQVRIGALLGLGVMGDARTVDAILALIDDDDLEVATHAFWALARIGSDRARDPVAEIIETSEHGPRRCAALEALKLVATEDDVDWARREFRRADADEECEEIIFEEPDERFHRIVWGEPVRIKWLKTVGNTDPYAHRRWLERLVVDPEETDHAKFVANEILREMSPD